MLYDSFGRKVDYIRVSVTEKCNFRCQYCMPNTPDDFFDKVTDIPLNNVLHFIKVAIDNGVKKIRITGGEPLLRKDLPDFIAKIYQYQPSINVALTTNAYFLAHFAQPLKESGLKGVNISLDSLKNERIALMSKRNALPQILKGIDAAINVGLKIKLNMVPLKGINDDEIIDLLHFAINKGVTLRYIEFMENQHAYSHIQGLRQIEILHKLQKEFTFKKIDETHGPATLYALGQGGVFGIIAPHNDDFCKNCNRIRLNAEGYIVPCLYFEDAVNIKQALLEGNRAHILHGIKQALHNKPEKNRWGCQEDSISTRAFYKTGG